MLLRKVVLSAEISYIQSDNQVRSIMDEKKQELVTRELFEERFKVIEEKFKVMEEKFAGLHLKMNIFIAIAIIALTFANPTFVELLKKIF